MSNRWKKIGTLFEAVVDLPPAARAAWLHEACGDDAELRREVEQLVAAHERAEGILDAPPVVPGGLLEKRAEEAVEERHIGPYRLIRELGRGGMSRVYFAERDDEQFTRQVAIKVLQQGIDSKNRRRRFAAERQILAALHHPHIARLYDGGVTEEGQPYFVMECVAGQPIDRYCDAKQLPIKERLYLLKMVCEAVEYAHRNLVIHRDLKPSNILVMEDGDGEAKVKLLDFGIAKLLDAEATGLQHPAPVTRPGMRLMTPEYASPEQVRGRPITMTSDVYSLGIILYELLTGQRPYRVTGRTPSEVEQVVCEEEPAPPSTIVAQKAPPPESGTQIASPDEVSQARGTTTDRLQRRLRGDLDTICLKALRKEPERRYGSAAALAEDLDRYLEGHPVIARPDTPGYRARKFIQRHRWGMAVAALLLLLLAGYAVTVTLQSRRIAEERDRAQLEAIKSAHVKDFLISLFGQSSAAHDGADTVSSEAATVEEVLAGGAERVRRDLADHPEIRAEMLNALGAVYEQLGQYGTARPLFEEALTARRAYFGEPHPAVAAALRDLAALEQRAGRSARAEVLFREALALQHDLYDQNHIAIAETQHNLAALLEAEGHTEEAVALYAEALPVYRRVLGSGHGQTASLMTNLATLTCEAGDNNAVALYREALKLERERLGRQHPGVAALRGELGSCLSTLGRYKEAERHLLVSLASLNDLEGSQLNRRRTVRAHLVTLYAEWGKPEQARAYEARPSAHPPE